MDASHHLSLGLLWSTRTQGGERQVSWGKKLPRLPLTTPPPAPARALCVSRPPSPGKSPSGKRRTFSRSDVSHRGARRLCTLSGPRGGGGGQSTRLGLLHPPAYWARANRSPSALKVPQSAFWFSSPARKAVWNIPLPGRSRGENTHARMHTHTHTHTHTHSTSDSDTVTHALLTSEVGSRKHNHPLFIVKDRHKDVNNVPKVTSL